MQAFFVGRAGNTLRKGPQLQEALHQGGHKYLKLLFVLALAGSSAMFFVGPAIPKPPALVVVVVGAVLGLALEWSYFTFSCDLTEAITEGNKVGIFVNGLYTLAGGGASWFLFTNAALHVGWAPTDDLLGLSRQTWAMIMAALIVIVIFVLSARRKRPSNAADLQALGRAVTIMLPQADDAARLRLMATIATAASDQGPKALPPGRVVEGVRRPGLLKRGWQALWSGEEVPARALAEGRGHLDEREDEQDDTPRHRAAEASSAADRLQEPQPRSREQKEDQLRAFAEALQAATGMSLEALVQQAFARGEAHPAAEQVERPSEYQGEAPLPFEYTHVPFPGVRTEEGSHRYTGKAGEPFRPSNES